MVVYFINNFRFESVDKIKPIYQTKDAVRKKAYSMVSGRSRFVKIGVIKDSTYRPGTKEVYYMGQVVKDEYDSSKLIYTEYIVGKDRKTVDWYLNKDGTLGAKRREWR